MCASTEREREGDTLAHIIALNKKLVYYTDGKINQTLT